jgi:hypothetical protein
MVSQKSVRQYQKLLLFFSLEAEVVNRHSCTLCDASRSIKRDKAFRPEEM